MTPLAGFVAAVIAGWIIREPRRAAAAVLIPFLAVLAAQTWTLASGRGINPPSTPNTVSYWVFQAIFLAFALGIATQLASWRRARSAADDRAGANRRMLQASALLVVLTAVFLPVYLLDAHPVLHHNTNSPLPVTGLFGIAACIVGLVVCSVLNIRGRRAAVAAS
jgi:hypothetical protein